MKRDFLTLQNFSPAEITEIVTMAETLKKDRYTGEQKEIFGGRSAVLIFDKPSLRTKITFETGIFELGGNALSMAANTGRLGERESIEDMAKNLDRWVHLLVVRTFSHQAVEKLAQSAHIPVINALTDEYHPCQSIALGLTLREHFRGETIHMAYIGDGNNVCVSHMFYAALTGHTITICTPPGYEPPKSAVEKAQSLCRQSGGKIHLTTSPTQAVSHADLVYTDVWASMGQEDEAQDRNTIFAPYQVNAELMKHAPDHALFSHCLPAHRGDEVSADIIDSGRSIVFDEAENRLHAHKSIITFLLEAHQ
ncbi:ornithine carbamoyltransferase [Chitinivibrio alkaliphilus]|uniref:Ornithine carbamoyltransferase n=1 Tax=Chitinivibrio alkaliphilus ACht1 TaxID=1313304 RepID=U7D4Q3_9BACT|nr:ornithine carbamoyltransferase [Chitinivibrio alkaliphilus]ERP31494.1 ornithine carbamoyltransferase [Chitinivibrio alkaliphilus ACht1]